MFNSDPLVGRAWDNNALRSDNSFVLTVYYQFSGGKQVNVNVVDGTQEYRETKDNR